MWHIHLKTLKLSGTESIHSSCYSEITDRGQKMTIFGKLAISPDEGPYRKNWSSQTLHQRPDYYRGNFRWNPSRHVLEKASAKCHLKRHLSPHLGLSKRVRVSPALFAYNFQDLTEQDLTEQDLIKLDLTINFKISKSLNHNQFKVRPYRFKRVLCGL